MSTPSKRPPTLPPLAWNSSMIFWLKSLNAATLASSR